MEPIDQGGCVEQFIRLLFGMVVLMISVISLLSL